MKSQKITKVTKVILNDIMSVPAFMALHVISFFNKSLKSQIIWLPCRRTCVEQSHIASTSEDHEYLYSIL